MPAPQNKRRHSTALGSGSGRSIEAPQKRARIQDARQIAVQTTDEAFKNGELNVDRFVKAREWEIRALELGVKAAKLVSTDGRCLTI